MTLSKIVYTWASGWFGAVYSVERVSSAVFRLETLKVAF